VRDELLYYYERELTFLRHMGAEFAERYPKVAGRLLLEAGKCEDPHVERLLEGFAFLAARVHLKVDDEFPEIIEGLFNILYPHYLRPIPSMSVVQFHLDPAQGKLTTGLAVDKGSILYSPPVGGFPCKFQTSYDVTLWPLKIQSAQWSTPDKIQPALRGFSALAALRIEVRCSPDVQLNALGLQNLRFYISGETTLAHTLLELLSNNCVSVMIRDTAAPARRFVTLPANSIRPLGFSDSEAILPYPQRSFSGYRILQEYFTFPEKFFFFELSGLDQAARAGITDKFEILFLISAFERADRQQALELGVSGTTFRLGCTPIVNLFRQTAEPFLLDQKRYEYRIVPDARREKAMDIFSIDEVFGLSTRSSDPVHYEPFHAYRHGSQQKQRAFWYPTRRSSEWRADKGSDVYLMLVDIDGRPLTPDEDTINIRLTCTNRDLPSRLPFGNEQRGDFELEGGSPIQRVVSLVKPTDYVHPPSERANLWRLLSQLSLNYLSLVSEGTDAFKEILRVYNFSKSTHIDRQIEGITEIHSRPSFGRVVSENGVSFARGTKIEIQFDEDQFVGGGAYTFSSILEHFLAHYVSMNSFSQLAAKTMQRKGYLREWPPRAGNRVLI
jgi:type VI secretion system protein ImpG